MKLITSLKEQLERLCRNACADPNWMIKQLSAGLRERYGATAVAFVRKRRLSVQTADTRSNLWRLLGCCDLSGELILPLGSDFSPDQRHPTGEILQTPDESWFGTHVFPQWNVAALDELFANCRSAFLVPWLVDQPSDWFILILSPIHAPSTTDRSLSMIANLLATSLLRSLDTIRLQQANTWIQRELDEIAHLQKLLQPDALDCIEGTDVAASSISYHYAGGDYFDVPVLTHLMGESKRVPGRDSWGAIIADVSGHGPSAAVEAAMLDAVMRTYPGPVDLGPASVMAYLNRNMFTRKPRAAFISAFVCNFDPSNNLLRFVSGGHPPALIKTKLDPICTELPVDHGIPIRVDPDYQWKDCQRQMAQGDILVLYTDGVFESRNPQGQELGLEGLKQLVSDINGNAEEMLLQLRQGIDQFTGQAAIADDQTILVFKF